MDKNYYMTQDIGSSGVANTQNPTYLTNDYRPFDISPRKINLGDMFSSDSKYDETLGNIQNAIDSGNTIEDLKEQQQSGWEMAGNALVNNLVIAGTSAIGGTLGIIDGIIEAAYDGEVNRLWNNSVDNWVADVQNQTREAFPIYRSQEYEDKSLFGKMGTGIFWADLVQNLGYTEGMLVPGIGVSRLLSSAPKIARAFIPSLVSAVGEASTEAINSKNDEIANKTKMATQLYNEMTYGIESPVALNAFEEQYRETLNNIGEDAINAGNFVFASNLALLSMTNTIEFGSLFSRGFSSTKRIKGIFDREGKSYVNESLGTAMTRAIGKKLLDATSEGLEEVGQSVISRTPSNLDYINTFNDSIYNPESRELASDIWSAIGKSLSETINDPQTAVEFASGFITGAIGVPMLRKSAFPITLQNNAFLEVRDAYKEWQDKNIIVDNINKRLQEDKKINSYYNGLVRHLAIQDRMNSRLNDDDIFGYKNDELSLFVNDAMMFDDAGGLSHLRQIINESIDMSDQGIDDIIEQVPQAFAPNGNKVSRNEARTILKEQIEKLQTRLDSYIEDKEQLERSFPDIPNEAMKAAILSKQALGDANKRIDKLLTISTDIIKKALQELEEKQGTEKVRQTFGIDSDINKTQLRQKLLSGSIKNLTELLSRNYTTVPYNQVRMLEQNLIDLSKLETAAVTYSQDLADILKNPQKAVKIAEQSAKRAQDRYNQGVVDNIKQSLKDVDSIGKVNEILEPIKNSMGSEITDRIINELSDENSELKSLLDKYKEITSFKEAVGFIIEQEKDPAMQQSLSNIILDSLDNAESLQDVEAILEDAVKQLKGQKYSKEIGDKLEQVINQAKDDTSSRRASKEKDSNNPEKKVKKKSSFSISDAASTFEEVSKDNEATYEEDSKPAMEKVLEKMSVTELEEVAKGKVPEGTPEEDSSKVQKLAAVMAKNKRIPSSDGQASGTNSERNVPSKDRSSDPYLRSWYHTKYRVDDLKDRNNRRAVKIDSNIVHALDELGAFDFVDEGKLGILFNKNPEIPIYYVRASDPRLGSVVVLAIQVNPNETNSNTLFKGQDGKYYQAVGALGYDSSSKKSQEGYRQVLESINSEYTSYRESHEEPGFYVVQGIQNKIKHIYSGRMVKTIDDNEPRQRPLSEVAGNRPILGVYYGNKLRVPMLDDQQDIVPLNDNNTNPRDGSVWVMSRESDGRWYAKAVKVKRFTAEEYDQAAHIKTPLMSKILEDIVILMNPDRNDYDRSIAKFDLMNILHFPKGSEPVFNGESVSIPGLKNNIGKGLDLGQKIQAMVETLQDKTLNLRFQVDPSMLSEELYVNDLLESDILTTDIAILHNVNSSFDLFIPNADGNITQQAKNPTGHTGQKGINNSISRRTLTLNGQVYQIDNNTGRITDSTGKKVSSDREVELLFLKQIEDKQVNPVEGNSRLYLGSYLNGTKFGISEGYIVRGEKLDQLLRLAGKTTKKVEQAFQINSLFSKVTSENKKKLDQLEEVQELNVGDYVYFTTPGGTVKEGTIKQFSKDGNTVTINTGEREIKASRSLLKKKESPVSTGKKSLFSIENLPDSVPTQKPEDLDESDKQAQSSGTLFTSASQSNLDRLRDLDKKEEEIIAKEEQSKKSKVIGETFVKGSAPTLAEMQERKENPDFKTLAKKNMRSIRELEVFKNISQLEGFVRDPANKLASIESIKTQEDFQNLLENIRCRLGK